MSNRRTLSAPGLKKNLVVVVKRSSLCIGQLETDLNNLEVIECLENLPPNQATQNPDRAPTCRLDRL